LKGETKPGAAKLSLLPRLDVVNRVLIWWGLVGD
jgi:hypothetical protein